MAVNVSKVQTIPLSIVAEKKKKKIDKCSNEIESDLNAAEV